MVIYILNYMTLTFPVYDLCKLTVGSVCSSIYEYQHMFDRLLIGMCLECVCVHYVY